MVLDNTHSTFLWLSWDLTPIPYNIHWDKNCGHWILIGQLYREGLMLLHSINAFRIITSFQCAIKLQAKLLSTLVPGQFQAQSTFNKWRDSSWTMPMKSGRLGKSVGCIYINHLYGSSLITNYHGLYSLFLFIDKIWYKTFYLMMCISNNEPAKLNQINVTSAWTF